MKLRLLAVVVAGWALAAMPFGYQAAFAADISVHQMERFDELHNGSIDVDVGVGNNMRPDGEIVCNVWFDGPIERGDLAKLKQIAEKPRPGSFDTLRLCLNSPGGSYNEGLAIAQYLMEHSIGTAIPAGAECYSACAIIFMGGTFAWKGELNRFLHVQGILGFHAPYIPSRTDDKKAMVKEDEVRIAFSEGIRAMSSFMQLGVGNAVKRVVPELMQEMMTQGPSEFFFVDTVGKAIRFRVHLYGIETIPPVNDRGICNACVNMNYGAYERYGAGGDPDLCTGLPAAQRETFPKGLRLTNDVAPRGGSCSVDVEMSGNQVASWSFVNDDRAEFGDGLELAYWYLYPPNTKIAALAKPVSTAPVLTSDPVKPEQDRQQALRRLIDFVVVEYLGHGRTDHENRAEIYAPRVVYFDKGEISRDAVMAEKRTYYKRWPKRSYTLIEGSVDAKPGPNDTLDMTFRYTFEVSNNRDRRSGTGSTRLGVALVEGRYVIVREAGGVERRR